MNDHIASIFLLDRAGNIVSEMANDAPEEQQAAALRRLLQRT